MLSLTLNFCIIWKFGFLSTWFVTIGTFVFVFYWALYKTEIDDVIQNNKTRFGLFAIGLVSFVMLTVLGKIVPVEIISQICMVLSMGIFAVLVMLVVYQISMDSRITIILGKI